MEKIVITGRIFEKILSKSGFTKADYARHVSKNDKKGRTRQWASDIILRYSTVEVPDRWVQELKELVGEEAFKRWAQGNKQLSDTAPAKQNGIKSYSVEEFAEMKKAGRLPQLNRKKAMQQIRSQVKPPKVDDDEFFRQLEEI
jgi:hypothetical protein